MNYEHTESTTCHTYFTVKPKVIMFLEIMNMFINKSILIYLFDFSFSISQFLEYQSVNKINLETLI